MQAFLLPLGGSRRFCLVHEPRGVLRGALLHVHPFAEEMNLSRRMTALQVRALAAAGYAVLQIDLFGCGDSEGDFGDATWSIWIDDIVAAANWLRDRTGLVPAFWGVRAGCLLAVAAARALARPARFLFWQAVLSGETHWRQFQRIQTAGAMIAAVEGDAGADTRGGAEREGAAEVIEVAGYRVSAPLRAGLTGARLDLPPTLEAVLCVESSLAGSELTPALAARVASWRAAGHAVRAAVVPAPTFWQSPDAAECPALLRATTELLAAEWS